MAHNTLPLEKELESIFLQKLPPFTDSTKNFFVQYGPYILLVLSIIGIIGLLTALGILSGLTSYSIFSGTSTGVTLTSWIVLALSIVSIGLFLIAFNPLKNRQRKGWEYLYYSQLVSLLSSLISFNIIGFLISGFLWFWVLFQIRDKYN